MVAVAVLECIGHKQNSLHARLPTEPILEIYDKQENGGVAEGEWGQYPWGGLACCMMDQQAPCGSKQDRFVPTILVFFKDNIWLPVHNQLVMFYRQVIFNNPSYIVRNISPSDFASARYTLLKLNPINRPTETQLENSKWKSRRSNTRMSSKAHFKFHRT